MSATCFTNSGLGRRQILAAVLVSVFVLTQFLYFVHIGFVHHSHSAVTGEIVHNEMHTSQSLDVQPTKCSVDSTEHSASDHEDRCLVVMAASQFAYVPACTHVQTAQNLGCCSLVQAQQLDEVFRSWSLLRLAPKHSPPLFVLA